MAKAVKGVVETWVRIPRERDAAVRTQLLEECFASDGRLISRSREVRGRAAMAELITQFLSDPQVPEMHVGVIDTGVKTFRYHVVLERRDGTKLEFSDSGLIDEDGRICLVLTFDGPLDQRNAPVAE
ncbi:MAG: hypothetical protein ACOY0T_30810 [Myxococcota bacterium]